MMGCKKCMMVSGIVFLVLGLLFLLADLDIWEFWGVQWWTALFLYLGVASLAMMKCPDCMAIREGKKK